MLLHLHPALKCFHLKFLVYLPFLGSPCVARPGLEFTAAQACLKLEILLLEFPHPVDGVPITPALGRQRASLDYMLREFQASQGSIKCKEKHQLKAGLGL